MTGRNCARCHRSHSDERCPCDTNAGYGEFFTPRAWYQLSPVARRRDVSADNGAFRLFNGVMPESVLQRCAEFASYVDGRLWCIDKKCAVRNEIEIYAALGRLFRAITFAMRTEVNTARLGNPDDGIPRGAKRPRPPP